MATTVSDATMRVVIREEINLDGTDMGREVVRTITGINEFQRFIKRCSVGVSTVLATFKATIEAPLLSNDWFDQKVKYIRITNLDSTVSPTLLINSDAGSVLFKMRPSESFLMVGQEDPMSLTIPGGSAAVTFTALNYIGCYIPSSGGEGGVACDLEVVIASA